MAKITEIPNTRPTAQPNDYLYAINAAGNTDYKYPLAQVSPLWINAKDPQYASLQAAINAADAAGGGVVFLPPGNYSISTSLVMKSNVTLMGTGRGVSIIVPTADTFAAVTAQGNTINWCIRDLSISYSTATGGTVSADANALGIKIAEGSGVSPYNFSIQNVGVESAYTGILAEVDAVNFAIRDFYADNVKDYGLYWNSPASSSGGVISGINVSSSGGSGVYLGGLWGTEVGGISIDSVNETAVAIVNCRLHIQGIRISDSSVNNTSLIYHFGGNSIISGLHVGSIEMDGGISYIIYNASGTLIVIGGISNIIVYEGNGTHYNVYSGAGAALTLVIGYTAATPSGSGGTSYDYYDAGSSLVRLTGPDQYWSNGAGPILTSPGGLTYRITVDDFGQLQVVNVGGGGEAGTTPAAVTNLALTVVSPSTITLDWDNVFGATGYIIYRSLDEGSTWEEVAVTDTNTYNDNVLSPNTEYTYRVMAVNQYGYAPDYSSDETATTDPHSGSTFYVATTGNDTTGDGTEGNPWATITKGISQMSAGDLLYVRGGTYSLTAGMNISGKDGTEADRFYMFAYPSETPIIDGTSELDANFAMVRLNGCDYWHIKGFKFQGSTAVSGASYIKRGLQLMGTATGIIIEDCEFTDNEGTGLHIQDSVTNSYIINCYSHANKDNPSSSGNNADGFAVKSSTSTGIEFIRCRAFDNEDDGFDHFEGPPVVHKWCISWHNGFIAGTSTPGGDGQGFKFGSVTGGGGHTFIQCVAHTNHKGGFDSNNTQIPSKLYNCTAWDNDYKDFDMPEAGVAHEVKNCIGRASSTIFGNAVIQDHNNWNLPMGSAVGFVTLDFEDAAYLSLTSNAPAIDAGVYLAEIGQGGSPDLGALPLGTQLSDLYS